MGKDEYEIGDKVLAHNNCLLYEAKIVKKEKENSKLKYLIHYLGWRDSWDEWVEPNKLLPVTPENKEKAKELHITHTKKQRKTQKSKDIQRGQRKGG